jgi:poly(3-hydroxybutyrate) depolymerase
MRSLSVMKAGLFTALVAGSLIASAQVPVAQPPGQPPAAAPAGPPPRAAADPRVQQRTYTFKDTNEEIPYAVFVSSKVSRDKKNPLIVALHGLGGDQNTMLRGSALQLAEEGGYILVGPMGYNSSGWYGAPAAMAGGTGGAGGGVGMGGPRGAGPGAGRPGGPPGGGPPGAGPAAGPGAGPGAIRGPGPGGGPGGPPGAVRPPPTTLGTPNEVSQRSEKDVLTVLDMIKKEFNVDENRTYLMGHSMGGAGSIYLGVKHASVWAGIGAIAPAHAPAGIYPQNYDLTPAKNIPMIIVQGDMDTLVPVAGVRQWIDKMKELEITHQYIEVAGGDHGNVLTTGVPDIFAFFAKHSKASR